MSPVKEIPLKEPSMNVFILRCSNQAVDHVGPQCSFLVLQCRHMAPQQCMDQAQAGSLAVEGPALAEAQPEERVAEAD